MNTTTAVHSHDTAVVYLCIGLSLHEFRLLCEA